MAFQPCPGIAAVTLVYTGDQGDIMENILHVSNGGSSAWSAANLATLLAGVDAWVAAGDGTHHLLDPVSNQIALSNYVARDLTTSSGPETTLGGSHVGSTAGAPAPAGISWAVTLRTGLSGRSYRGRVFSAGLSMSQIGGTYNNEIGSGTANAIVAAWSALITKITSLNAAWYWCVLSRRTNNALRANGIGTAITSVGYSSLELDYQRRRAPLHGRHH
jgi:hypothetical protein